jgi:thiol:disulfide interchange protein DsbA
MAFSRRQFNRALLSALAIGVWSPAQAAKAVSPASPTRTLVEGRDWMALTPAQPGDSPGRIEVLEFFSYGCGHCKDFHPLITPWAAKLPKDVAFRRVPVTFGRAAWSNLARLFYSLEVTGNLTRLDQAVFDAIHLTKTNLYSEKAALDWAQGQGANAGTLRDAFRSFAVENKLARAEQLTRLYKVNSVPQITVDGHYAVLGQAAKGLPDLLAITDGLIDFAREGRRTARKSASPR